MKSLIQLFHSFVSMSCFPLDYKGVIMVKDFLLQEKSRSTDATSETDDKIVQLWGVICAGNYLYI